VPISIALANSGDVQLELIQQRCSTPSMYRDFLAAGHEGMQHWSSWPENYDEIYQRPLATGYTVGQEGDSPRGRLVYFRNEATPAGRSRWRTPRPRGCAFSTRSMPAAADWDGSNPVRRQWPS